MTEGQDAVGRDGGSAGAPRGGHEGDPATGASASAGRPADAATSSGQAETTDTKSPAPQPRPPGGATGNTEAGVAAEPGRGRSEPAKDRGAQGVATALAEISDRATVLIHEEIELAKAEVTEKVSTLARGAAVGVAAGIFVVTALFFVLIGCAWVLYYYLPIGTTFTYFVGFFAMALILLVLGVVAGLVAARVVRRGSPPTPEMAIEEARRIRETVSAPEAVSGPASVSPDGETARGEPR